MHQRTIVVFSCNDASTWDDWKRSVRLLGRARVAAENQRELGIQRSSETRPVMWVARLFLQVGPPKRGVVMGFLIFLHLSS